MWPYTTFVHYQFKTRMQNLYEIRLVSALAQNGCSNRWLVFGYVRLCHCGIVQCFGWPRIDSTSSAARYRAKTHRKTAPKTQHLGLRTKCIFPILQWVSYTVKRRKSRIIITIVGRGIACVCNSFLRFKVTQMGRMVCVQSDLSVRVFS